MISLDEAIHADPPEVWLNGFFGFDPQDWGCVTFTDRKRLEEIRAMSRPGFLTIAYGTTSADTPSDLRGRILGIYQCSHETGDTERFLSPLGRQRKREKSLSEKSWNQAFRVVQAWKTTPETAPNVADFAHLTYSPEKGRVISRRSRRLEHAEALKILDLDLFRVPVHGADNDFEPVLTTGRGILSPSKAGPVSQSPHVSREAEGPKHLYVLTLDGPLDAVFDEPLDGRLVVKVGFSRSPAMRCEQFNKALPECLLRWRILHSTDCNGGDPLPDSIAARHGEDAMKLALDREGQSRGGEFFLATKEQIDEIWCRATREARDQAKGPQ